MASTKFTSIDFARLICWYAWNKHGVLIGKTQMQKILYVCYGFWLAKKGETLFEECPAAWPFGPVFPSVYVWYSAERPEKMTQTEINTWNSIMDCVRVVFNVVDKLCHVSAKQLTDWSHRPGSPWDEVRSSSPWGTEIPKEKIKEYFKGDWHIGLRAADGPIDKAFR